jgi:arabinofuranosyltransferase
VLVLVVVAGFVAAAWAHRWVTEDAFIDFRIVHQIFAGNGPVFNVGQRVEAGTSPLWLLVLVVARALTLNHVDLGWLAVVLGLVLSTVALLVGVQGARLVGGGARPATRYWPAGLLVVVMLPPMWDFATSGLETSLSFAWLGTCFWLLARRSVDAPDQSPARPAWLLVLLGLGTLVRPDLAIFTVTFLIAHLLCSRPGWKARCQAVAIALALPLLVEVARMAYYGSLVPNTAIAKEAGLADWARGWAYLVDFVKPYGLVLPLAMVVILGATLPWRRWIDDRRWDRISVVLAPVIGGVLSAIYVVRIGGDFMHARMLLPALFAIVLPVFVWVPQHEADTTWLRRRGPIVALSVLAVSMLFIASSLRVPYAGGLSPVTRIADERGFYVGFSGNAHPITADDYARSDFGKIGLELHRLAQAGRNVLVMADGTQYRLRPGSGVVAVDGHIGVTGILAGDDVHIIDPLGLADPLAARMELLRRGRAGHEKNLPDEWILAEYGIDVSDIGVHDARSALSCAPLRNLSQATTAPLSLSELARNLSRSFPLTWLRVPQDSELAVQKVC